MPALQESHIVFCRGDHRSSASSPLQFSILLFVGEPFRLPILFRYLFGTSRRRPLRCFNFAFCRGVVSAPDSFLLPSREGRPLPYNVSILFFVGATIGRPHRPPCDISIPSRLPLFILFYLFFKKRLLFLPNIWYNIFNYV